MVIEKEMGQILTAGEVARILHIHVNTVRRWADQGRITAVRISSRGDRRFRREDVIRYLTELNAGNDGKKKANFNLSYR